MARAVYINLDGLRRDHVTPELTPNLWAFKSRATWIPNYRSVFPSATRVVSSTFATGTLPARHGLEGNTMALVLDGRIKVFDAGHPEFLQQKRALTGKSLAEPTLAERLANTGGAIVFNNVSPGAAYAHDPDGFGYVYHRAGSFGPGRKPVADSAALAINLSPAGDRAMTDRFVGEALEGRKPALAVLWTGEPDHTQHECALGSPEHLAVLRSADANAGHVIAAVDRLRAKGEDVLLMIGSDHGHETVTGVVDIDVELVAAGLKKAEGSDEVAAISNGTSALVYVAPSAKTVIMDLGAFLARQTWAGKVVAADRLAEIGQSPARGIAFAVSMRSDVEPNEHGVRGRSLVAKPNFGKADRLGFGQHGGLGAYEQTPFLIVEGPGCNAGSEITAPASPVDLAPTILRHLGEPHGGLDGRALQLTAA